MYGRGLHILLALAVGTITMLAPDGGLTDSVAASSLGVQAGMADVREGDGHATSVSEVAAGTITSAVGASGAVNVTVTVVDPTAPPPPPPPAAVIPVYRFYSPKSGTHFYTPSPDERDMVIVRWPDVWHYEGVAYWVNPARNSRPLYRFYNRVNGSHFYTASADERDTVFARWMNIFSYDGETYAVTPGPEPGKTPVYRFLNMKNGSHFYTASLDEANTVIATWPDVYRLEGPAFWLGQ